MPAVLNPIMTELQLNGSLIGRDRSGAFTATSGGAFRYQPVPESRHNYFPNGSFEYSIGLSQTVSNWGSSGTFSQVPGGTHDVQCLHIDVVGYNRVFVGIQSTDHLAAITAVRTKQVWFRFKIRGTGNINQLGILSMNTTTAQVQSYITDYAVPSATNWSTVVLGPITVPADSYAIWIDYLGKSDGSQSFSIDIDEVMLATENPTGWEYFDTTNGGRVNLVPDPLIGTGVWPQSGTSATVDSTLPRPFGTHSNRCQVLMTQVNAGPRWANFAYVGPRINGDGVTRYSFSYYVYHELGTSHAFKVRVAFSDANAIPISAADGATFMVPSGTWTRVSHVFTADAGSSTVIMGCYKNTAVAREIFWVNAAQIEASPSVTSFIYPGVWLEPRTGQPGTPNSSPSVSRASAWIEEGTTNLILNPSIEVNTNQITSAPGCTQTRDTTRAYMGSASVHFTADGLSAYQNIGFSTDAIGGASASRTFTSSAWVVGAAGATLRLIQRIWYNGYTQAFDTVVPFVTTGGWQRVTATGTINVGFPPDAILVAFTPTNWAGSSASANFWVDCVQTEEKPYATSYCDGSLGTGYGWTGTAHLSTSTRSSSFVSFPNANHFPLLTGAVMARYQQPYYALDDFSRTVWGMNYDAVAGNNQYFARLGVDGVVRFFNRDSAGSYTFNNTITSKALATLVKHYSEFTQIAKKSAFNNEALSASTAHIPTTGALGATPFYVGANGGTRALNSVIGPILIYDQLLSDDRRAKIGVAIDSNGAIDIWTMFEEFDSVIASIDTFDLESIEATTGGSATISEPSELSARGQILMTYLPITAIGGLIRIVPVDPVQIARFAEDDG